MRRVVVTGLGAITPLGVGVRPTWRRLLASESGLVSVADRGRGTVDESKWRDLTSTVAGVVPTEVSSSSSLDSDDGATNVWRPSDWLQPSDQRRMSTFAQYAVAAAEMALRDAGWKPTRADEMDMTGVCLGSGIGNLHDFYATSVAFERDVGLPSFFHSCCSCLDPFPFFFLFSFLLRINKAGCRFGG
jgi:3-oxoacyl-[acyl-carrier-protein] synthase II